MKLCQHCKKEVNETDLFCGGCGQKVDGKQVASENKEAEKARKSQTTEEDAADDTTKTSEKTAASTEKKEASMQGQTSNKTDPSKREKPTKSKLPAIVLLVLGIAVGVLLSYFLNKDDASPVATDEVAADVNEEENNAAKEAKKKIPKEKSVLNTKGKEKVAVADIVDKAAQVFSGKSGKLNYDLYLVQENVRELQGDDYSTAGIDARSGEIVEASDIVFYLAEQGKDFAFRQEQLEPFEYMRNLTNLSASGNNWYEKLKFPDYSLLALYKYFDIFSYREIHLFDVIDGEVKQVNLDDFRYAWYYPKIKAIDEDKIQLVILEESSEDKWYFDTYEYDRKNAKMSHYNEKSFEKFDPFENSGATAVFENWQKNDDAYVPYTKVADRKVWDVKSLVKNASDGRLGDVPVTIGDSMIDIYDKNKVIEFMSENPTGVAAYVAAYYDTYTVGYAPMDPDIILESNEIQLDFRGDVSFIEIPGEYLTFTLDEMKKELGKPDQDVFAGEHLRGDEHDYYGYDMGAYTLIITVNKAANEIEEIQLAEWNVVEYVGLLDPESYEARLSQQ